MADVVLGPRGTKNINQSQRKPDLAGKTRKSRTKSRKR